MGQDVSERERGSARDDRRALLIVLVVLLFLICRRLELPPPTTLLAQVDKDRLRLPIQRGDEHLAVADGQVVSFRLGRKGTRKRGRTCCEDVVRRS